MYLISSLHELVIIMYLQGIFHVITKQLHGHMHPVNYHDTGGKGSEEGSSAAYVKKLFQKSLEFSSVR